MLKISEINRKLSICVNNLPLVFEKCDTTDMF